MSDTSDGSVAISAVDVAVEEFRALRAELTSRIEKQQEITNFALVVVAGLAALLNATRGTGTLASAVSGVRPLLPFTSLVLTSFLFMTLDHEMNIAHISLYIDSRLRPAISGSQSASRPGTAMLGWNEYRARWQQHAGRATVVTSSIASAKYAATVVPNLLILGSFNYGPGNLSRWTTLMYVVAWGAFIWALCGAMYTARTYLKMPHEKPRAGV